MTETETETYLNLLGCKLHLDEQKYMELVSIARRNRMGQAGVGLGVAMNYGVAMSALGEHIPPGLIAHMELVGRIAPTLCGGTEGNPRQIKRFMNTLLLRQRLAATRSITLDAPVLAKLMLLEYFHEPSFRELFRWQAEPGGAAARLGQLEAALTKSGDTPKTLQAEIKNWIDDSALRDWLILDPPLGQVDLAPYLYFSRDRALTRTAPSRRLSQQLQQLLGQLLSDTAAVRSAGTKTAKTMGVDEFRPVYEQLLDRFTRDPRALNGNLGTLIVALAADKRELIPSLVSALRAAPPTAVTSTVPVTIATMFGAKQQPPPDLKALLEEWGRQTVNAGLAKAAEVALRPTRAR